MIHKRFAFFALILLSFSAISHAFTLSDLQEKLTVQKLLRGQYIQSKNMQMFKQPLISKGDFLLEQQGLLWLQKQPFSVSLVLTQDKLSQQFADQPPQIIEAVDNPMVFYFSHLFLSLFKGDVKGLTTQFDMLLQGNSEQWLLILTPKEAPLDKVFKQISISGSQYINELQLIELNDDNSTIQFINQNNIPNSLSDHEQHYFQF